MVYEEYIKQFQSPFVHSKPPPGLEHVRIPDRRLIRWSEAKKAEVSSDNLARRQHEESLREQRRSAKARRLLKDLREASSTNQIEIDASELNELISRWVYEDMPEADYATLTFACEAYLLGDPKPYRAVVRQIKSKREALRL